MSQPEEKLEDLTLEEMKKYLLDNRPALTNTIRSLTEEETVQYYSKVFKEEEKKCKSLSQDNDEEPVRKTGGKRKKESKGQQTKQKGVEKEEEDFEDNETEKIRDILINSLPEMKEKLKIFNSQELQELYQELINTTKGDNDTELTEMVQQIKTHYPQLRHKVHSYSPEDIKKVYQSILSNPYFKPLTPKPTYVSASKMQEKADIAFKNYQQSFNGANRQNQDKIAVMREELKRKIPEESANIDQLTDAEIEELYEQESGGGSPIYSQTPAAPPIPPKSRPTRSKPAAQSPPVMAFNSHVPQIINNNNDECYQFQHKQGGQIKARTFMFVHTIYEQPKKLPKRAPMGKCHCPCCKNNTIVNLYNQLKNYFERKN